MGKHSWMKHVSDEHDHHKQPGCLSGLINVLDYHHWNSNTGKMIHHNKYAGQTGCWSPKMSLFPHDPSEVEKLLVEKQSPFLKSKKARRTNKRSLKSRIKALIVEEMYKESNNAQTKEGFLLRSRLQRTYSIHHQESLDDSISKISTDWKNPIIFIPSKENYAHLSVDITRTEPADSNGGESNMFSAAKIGSFETDLLDIFKIDKEFFVKYLQISNESVTHLSRNGLGSNEQLKLSKSRSFPDLDSSQRLKFKPSKLADKQKEIWSFPKGEKLQSVSQELKLTRSDEKGQDPPIKVETQQKNEWMAPPEILEGIVDIREGTTMGGVGEITMRNYSHSRSSSLCESLDKYARLFENSYGTNSKLNMSRSSRLTNENGHASMYFRTIRSRSLSNAESFYSNLNFGVVGDDLVGNGSFVTAKDGCFGPDIIVEDDVKVVRLVASDSEKKTQDLIETVECKTESADDMQRMEEDAGLKLNTVNENSQKMEGFKEEAQKLESGDSPCMSESVNCCNPCLISDSDIISHENLSSTEQLKISEDKFVESVGHDTDSHYVRLILDQSGIAKDASERAWHASDQPLSPQVFENVEACLPHEHDQLISWPDFCSSCWQHQMLFDLVNEALVGTYDVSLPYYPKALSSGCHVRPFPVGDRITEEVSTSISKLLNLRTDEKQSSDCMMVRDLKDDYKWMNLQFESECVGLELEDMIFDELVEELVCF